jgi:hypothetical protein
LTSISFELLSGSAILEVGELDKRTPIRISTPNATFYARRDGLVRFDLLGDATRVSVRQGELRTGTLDQVLANEGEKIGRGRVALFRGSSLPELAKVDRDAFDDFDVWSFGRARTLVEANNNALSRSRGVQFACLRLDLRPALRELHLHPAQWALLVGLRVSVSSTRLADCFTCLNSLHLP